MPELPEVEIVKQSLKKKIKLKKIKKVIVKNRNLRFRLHKDFEKNLKNRFIRKILKFTWHSNNIVATIDIMYFTSNCRR